MKAQSSSTRKAPFGVFLATSMLVFGLSLSAADSVGFVPCQLDGTCDSVTLAELPQLGIENMTGSNAQGSLPTEIKIPSVGIDLPVQNPNTTDLTALDALLTQGPARYQLSGELGENKSMVIFAHSSHLVLVKNKMFQAFNQVPNLNPGDSITVVGADGKSYLYSVDSVIKASTDDNTNYIQPNHNLVLITCDTLTGTNDRFVLTAHFVGVVG